jgi:inosose dehydratase
MKIAGAPISWGVGEVPGWGHRLGRDRVLAEMRDLGLTATEFGPEGFLPEAADERDALLAGYGLRGIGGFVPVVLHQGDPLPGLRDAIKGFGPGDVVVLAAATAVDGYDERPVLATGGWRTLLGNLDRIAAEAADSGRDVVLHPHVGTMVETRAEVHRVLDGCAMPLCLDTGHLLIGGTDPAELAGAAAGRVAHVHLKDADAGLAARVRAGELTYTEGVRAGMYRPLGRGDVDVARIVTGLRHAGYQGWYVLEQDVMLTGERDRPADDVRVCLDLLASLT